MTDYLSLGVIGTAFKENEHRVPLHPDHFAQIPEEVRKAIHFESGYGDRFGLSDEDLGELFAGTKPRAQLFQDCKVVLLPKPTSQDFDSFQEGQILWGWPHCVQGEAITQQGIDKKMTMIAWEAMHGWKRDGSWAYHTFHKNNEMAGYCSVLHALSLAGFTGHYGKPHRRAAVISFGSTARGSVHALQGMGFGDITVYTQRAMQTVTQTVPGLTYREYHGSGSNLTTLDPCNEEERPFAEELCEYDVIVNCILQDTDSPLMFLGNEHVEKMMPRSLIVDVSCDEGMGFEFAKPTSFEDPAFRVGPGVLYYAVDHTPSYLWESASYDISMALLPYIETVLKGPEAWAKEPTIAKSIEIQDGVIQNPKILSFQGREADYPHPKKQAATV